MYVVSKYVPETYSRKIILKVKKLIYQSGHFFLNNGKAIKVKKKKGALIMGYSFYGKQ